MTWFDALLVTLLAMVTALGARRGLAGLGWGLGGVATCFLANFLGTGAVVAGIIALALSAGVAYASQRLIPNPLERPWHLAAGAVGGFALGGVLVTTLALGFPIEMRVGPQGRTGIYPSSSLSPVLYDAVNNSAIKGQVMGIWGANPALKTLLVPDQTRAR
jgi:hypothetical protein